MCRPSVSVLVPVYNVEKYLAQCLDSLLYQTYNNYSIILVDDGSTDRSGQICDDYAKRFNDRITLIHKANGGLASARNAGIEIAESEYIVFVDSDDYVDKEFLSALVQGLYENGINCKPDLVVNGDKTILEGKVVKRNNRGKYFLNSVEKILQLLYDVDGFPITQNSWGKLFRLDIVKNNNIRIDENISLGEDGYFNFYYMINCRSAYINFEADHYNYRNRYDSMSKERQLQPYEAYFWHLTERKKILHEMGFYSVEKYNDVLVCSFLSTVIGLGLGEGKKEYLTYKKYFTPYYKNFAEMTSKKSKRFLKVFLAKNFTWFYGKLYTKFI